MSVVEPIDKQECEPESEPIDAAALRMAQVLALPEAVFAETIELAVRGYTPACITLDEIGILDSLLPDRLAHVESCTFCMELSAAIHRSAQGAAKAFTDLATKRHCPDCGAVINADQELQRVLSRFGISDDLIDSVKSSMAKVDVGEYLETARNYLTVSSSKASNFARDNPGKVATGVAVLALGAGLLVSSLRERD
jgi:rubredoxin